MDFALVLDILVFIVLLISCVVAFLRGFVREALTIIGLVGAVMAALTLGPIVTPSIESWFTSGLDAEGVKNGLWGVIPYDIAAAAISYLSIFVIVLTILSISSHYIAKSVHAIGMGPVDRSLGVVFGLIRGAVLIGLLFLPFHILMEEEEKVEKFGSSNSYNYVTQASNIIVSFLPESWNKKAVSEKAIETDLLKDLTGEETIEEAAAALGDIIGTDETAAEAGDGYNDFQREAIDALIQNQDNLPDIMGANDLQNSNGVEDKIQNE